MSFLPTFLHSLRKPRVYISNYFTSSFIYFISRSMNPLFLCINKCFFFFRVEFSFVHGFLILYLMLCCVRGEIAYFFEGDSRNLTGSYLKEFFIPISTVGQKGMQPLLLLNLFTVATLFSDDRISVTGIARCLLEGQV